MHRQQNNPFITRCDVSALPQQQTSTALQGWQVAVKDLFHMAGLPTSAGNPDWLASQPQPTATASAVSQLLAAGARVIGKTITDELAYSLNGDNHHYPRLHNSQSSQHYCGGSSSGSALAVAQDLARIGLGTDTGGSIRVPASYNNLFGFRPSHGVIPMDHVVPLAPEFDTVGWMTHTAADALQVGRCLLPEQDSSPADEQPFGLLTAAFELCDYRAQGQNWIAHNLAASEQLTDFSQALLERAGGAFRVLQGRQIWRTHGDWIRNHRASFDKDIQQRFDWCQQLTAEQEQHARQIQAELQHIIDRAFSAHSYLVLPTTPGAAPRFDLNPKALGQYRNHLIQFTCLAGLSGRPQVHLPLFRGQHTSYGLSIIGKRHGDRQLLEMTQKIMDRWHENAPTAD